MARRAWMGLAISALGAGAALLLWYIRMLPKIVEQPDIVPAARTLAGLLRFGTSFTTAVTLFGLRTMLRSRQHRMILSFYLSIGLAIVVGYSKTRFVGLDHATTDSSTTFLLASILMIPTILAIRVLASIPIALPSNWIIRVTQVRPAHQYQRAVRFFWITLGVVPVLLVTAGSFLAGYPWQQVVGHLVTMLCFGMLLVELCLYSFRKIPFTCSYLPGKANIHFVFWACLLGSIRGLKEAASFEGQMLTHLSTFIVMILILALAMCGLRLFNEVQAKSTSDLLFEEEYEVEIVSLKLS